MQPKLNCYQFKINCYNDKMFYVSHITTKKNPVAGMQHIKRIKAYHYKHHHRKDRKRERMKQIIYKTVKKQF